MDPSLKDKGKGLKTPQSTSRGGQDARSEHLIEIPLAFKSKNEKKQKYTHKQRTSTRENPGSSASVCETERSFDFPYNFRDKLKKTPEFTHEQRSSSRGNPGSSASVCETERSSDIPHNFRDRLKKTPGFTREQSSSTSETPGSSASVCETERSLDFPYNFRDGLKKTGFVHEQRSSSRENPGSPASVCETERSSDIPHNFRDKLKKTGFVYEQRNSSRENSGSSASVCETERSSDIPHNFRDKLLKTSQLTSRAYQDMRSEHSIEIPLAFKGKNVKSSQSPSSVCQTERSSDIPHNFKEEKEKLPYGLPRGWGGHVLCPRNPPRFTGHIPVYPVINTDPRAPDDFMQNRAKVSSSSQKSQSADQDKELSPRPTYINFNQRFSFSTLSSDTSDYSSTVTSESRDSQFDEDMSTCNDIEEKVMCDICHKNIAVKICLTCNILYCEVHGRDHYKAEALQRHKLMDVSAEIKSKRCHHYQMPLDFFCRSDQMQICILCGQGKHKGHDIISQKKMFNEEAEYDPGFPGEVVPPPGTIQFLSVEPNSVVLSWRSPIGLEGPKSFRVKWSNKQMENSLPVKNVNKAEIDSLQPGQQYFFRVATEDKHGNLSDWVTESVYTAVPPPRHLKKGHSEATAIFLNWTTGENLEGIPHQFTITVESPQSDPIVKCTKECYKKISDLKPDTEYSISVSTVLNGLSSEPVTIVINTEPCLTELLSQLGLEDQYDNKLTLNTVLEINENDTNESGPTSTELLLEAFLKRLMMLNKNARSVNCTSCEEYSEKSNAINPLDLITALFLSSDNFLQQHIVLKMVQCHFAVPLLLPNSETREITMMLWSMREIVQTFRPSRQAYLELNCEERIVHSDFPLVSFVRLGKTVPSKSELLNELLSSNKMCIDPFYHRNMKCGDVPRRISGGLVEISWYLPCGTRSTDKFTEPLAVANLRGDIRAFDNQFSFLCQTSAAVYIFCDESDTDYLKCLVGKDVKANIFLISSAEGKTFTLKLVTREPQLKINNVSKKKKTVKELMKALEESISKKLDKCEDKVSLVNQADIARRCGFLVDEDSDECQSGLKIVHKITKRVTNISEFKGRKLRRQGFEMAPAMSSFVHGVVTSEVQRYYFLKWLEIELDDLSRNQLSSLQHQYEELLQKPPKRTEKITEIDKQISDSSLRVDHFIRECVYLYEHSSCLPEQSNQRKTIEQLPSLFAQMLLDGFPLELVDGDAASIPMEWITAVLKELHSIMQSDSKLKVVTIIGAENSGKSTLLNTMFGVRFSVSKGRCTRGAYIQLISVHNDVREKLGCDCILIIDTEGLKPHQMVQDDHSHEPDKEVASLAVALSDVTMVSVSSDKSNETDVLEMVLHAFTRLKGKGNKPLCHFIHANMSDMPIADRKKRDEELVEQLNKMILKDTSMKKENITNISDVMEFDPDTCSWYFPSPWQGTPLMASFSEYSETVHALKKQLIRDLTMCKERGDLIQFTERVKNSWKAVRNKSLCMKPV